MFDLIFSDPRIFAVALGFFALVIHGFAEWIDNRYR